MLPFHSFTSCLCLFLFLSLFYRHPYHAFQMFVSLRFPFSLFPTFQPLPLPAFSLMNQRKKGRGKENHAQACNSCKRLFLVHLFHSLLHQDLCSSRAAYICCCSWVQFRVFSISLSSVLSRTRNNPLSFFLSLSLFLLY